MNTSIIVALVFVTLFAYGQQAEDTLQLVHVFFRHGSRTPEEKHIFPNDPYKMEDFQPMGYGQLTNDGKQMAYQLGKLLRGMYDTFLGDLYTADLVEATSTDFDRTKMSALLALAGLFPPSSVQMWDDNLSWIPIPYNFEKNEYDYFMRRPLAFCPTYVAELERAYNSTAYRKVIEENQDILMYIEENVGRPIRTLEHAFGVFLTLGAEDYMNLTLPAWTKAIYPEPIGSLARMQCDFENYNDILKSLSGGRMLKRVIENMRAKVEGSLKPDGRKLYLYSGHEYNVINVLAALNIFKPRVPNYSAAAVIELHKLPETNEYFVKVLYSEGMNSEAILQNIPGCESACNFEKFVELTKPYLPLNYTAECRSETYLG